MARTGIGALLLSLLLLLHSPAACGAPPQPRGTLCRTKPTDLVFIIDSSRSVRPHEFEKIKVFVSRVIEALDVGPNATRVGIINYASAVRSELSLQSPQSKAALLQAVRRIQPLSTGTMTGLAIQFAISRAFSAAEGGRAGAPNFRKESGSVEVKGEVLNEDLELGVHEDAQPGRGGTVPAPCPWQDPVPTGFRMFAVGVGNAVEDELREIASEPVAEHYFYTADFRTISKIGKKLQIKICAEEDPCECKSIVKFQTKVEDLINSLQQKLEAVAKRIEALENKII
ncbi:cartilage matrix protein [Oenanthe melanoleuca]|uniref:cartilage matrix protein n=1 Tax=Oenanthe melanoleuca TaxID=2939378 RepID=UPI0024C12154|nr:cartilage matrix protein [Oenanthe melanoleuca]